MPGIGEQLRAARTARGLTIQDVQAELRIREKYLDALETDDFRAIPGIVYARGFLRSYARYLDLDAEALLQQLPTADPQPAEEPDGKLPQPKPAVPPVPRLRRPLARRRPARQWPWVVLPILFLAVLLYYFGALRNQPAAGGKPQTQQQTPPPASGGGSGGSNGGTSSGGSGGGTGSNAGQGSQTGSQGALTQAPTTQAPQPLGGPQFNYVAAKGPISATLVLTGQCWVYVSQDGSIVAEKIEQSGTYTFTANQSLVIKIGYTPAATLTINGQNVTPQGVQTGTVGVTVQG